MVKFKRVRWKNFLSGGNTFTEIDINLNGGLTLITSEENGAGKCLDKNTSINIKVDDDIKKEFEEFMKNR